MPPDPDEHFRPIRSFVRREGRITPAQQRAIIELMPKFGLSIEDGPVDFAELFGRECEVVMEIGFGNGISLADMAGSHPEQGFIGVEVYRPGMGSLLVQVRQRGLENVRVSGDDGVDVLEQQVPEGSLHRLQIFFPDPWHKKRHHKRRLVQPGFVEMAAARLRPGGVLHVATDWENYAEQILEVLESEPSLENTVAGYAPRPEYRPTTKYETRGERLGHGVWDIVFQRRS